MTGKLILPGLIDPHVHLREPGQTQKEDFYTGTSAAIAGGFTTVLDMPNNKIPITTLERLNEKIGIAKEKIVCDIGFYFGSLGDNLEEFSARGRSSSGRKKVEGLVFGLKLYLNETTGNFLIDKENLERIFKAWAKVANKPILLHAEDDAVSNVIELVEKLRNRVHFCHISTSSDLKQIIKAKEKGLPITCGVTPHHLFLNESDVKTLGPFGRMKPPLRSKRDVDFLWKNLRAINVVESDHAPHTLGEKMIEQNAPYGVPGLETTLPLLLTAVHEKRLVIEDILRLCYENPKRIFSLRPQGLTHVDLNKSYLIDNKYLFTKCGWSPFNGWRVRGKIQKVFIRGKKVFEDGKILAKPGFGKILTYD